MPTLIAGVLYPFRVATGVPLDHNVVKYERSARWVEKPIEGSPGKTEKVLETPKEPVKWQAYVLYFKPIVILLNVVPLWLMLVFYARLLDRVAENDWAWFFCLFSAALGTYLYAFDSTLNNHTIAAASAFFALYPFSRIWDDGRAFRRVLRDRGVFRRVLCLQRAPRRALRRPALPCPAGPVPEPDAFVLRPGGGGPLHRLPRDAVPGVRSIPARLRGVRDEVVRVLRQLLDDPSRDGLVQQGA